MERDFDEFDNVADHLIVVDTECSGELSDGKIVGTYRLLRQDIAETFGRFYTADEYDISPLLESDISLMELGRSCVLAEYRTRPVLQLLWQGIAGYVMEHEIGLMFGCASFHGTVPKDYAEPFSYLYHFHLAERSFRPVALSERYVDLNMIPKNALDPRKCLAALPPLVKGYIRLGAQIGDGAVIDRQFNTTDVCIVLQTHLVTGRYRKHYERREQKIIPAEGFPRTSGRSNRTENPSGDRAQI